MTAKAPPTQKLRSWFCDTAALYFKRSSFGWGGPFPSRANYGCQIMMFHELHNCLSLADLSYFLILTEMELTFESETLVLAKSNTGKIFAWILNVSSNTFCLSAGNPH